MDIKINNEEGNFKFRVAGILENNGKYLCTKMDNNLFYCLPGGHVEIGETTDEAIKREMQEELGFPVKITRLLSVAQNFYEKNGKKFHEFSYYYMVSPVNVSDVKSTDYERIENDKGVMRHLEFKWITKEDFSVLNFNPVFVKDILLANKTMHVVNHDGKNCKISEF